MDSKENKIQLTELLKESRREVDFNEENDKKLILATEELTSAIANNTEVVSELERFFNSVARTVGRDIARGDSENILGHVFSYTGSFLSREVSDFISQSVGGGIFGSLLGGIGGGLVAGLFGLGSKLFKKKKRDLPPAPELEEFINFPEFISHPLSLLPSSYFFSGRFTKDLFFKATPTININVSGVNGDPYQVAEIVTKKVAQGLAKLNLAGV